MEIAGGGPPPDGTAALPAAGYTLERELGRGGMAVVYLARDRKHDRAVAVKVLHAELAAVVGAERFLQEIRVTAHLQHPHILGLIDSGVLGPEAGVLAGRPFYVMPYVAGKSLRARLEREGQLPVADALRIAREVAGALDYAHRHGVVHRDVKPENILLDEDGQALVADFGIALAVEHAGEGRLTQTGLSLGTPQYMSPEQAMGERQITPRADVYALGAVLYEMLAGEPPFTGPTAQAVVARVLTESPRSLTGQRPSVPPPVDAAVRTALEKLPADRFASAAAFAAALAAVGNTSGTASAGAWTPAARPRRRLAVIAATLAFSVLAGAALAAALVWRLVRASTGGELVQFAIAPDSAVLRPGAPTISPDGRTVVYAAAGADGTRLYARRMDELVARPIPGTEGGEGPFFAPDGALVGFYSDGAIRKVPLSGGPAAVVTPLPAPTQFIGAAWAPDGTIFFTTRTGECYRVPAAGGAVVHVPVDLGVGGAPQLLPGGRALLIGGLTGTMGVVELSSGRFRLLGGGNGPRYAAGYLLYTNSSSRLFRQPFDVDRLAPTGAAEEIASDVQAFDASPSGSLVYRVGVLSDRPSSARVALTDRAGREQPAFAARAARAPWAPRFSPDGLRIAFGAYAPGHDSSDVWVADLAAGTTQRLTTDGADNNDPQWSPDGDALVYGALRPATDKDLFVHALAGGGARRLTSHAGFEWVSDWSPDGSSVLFSTIRSTSGSAASLDVWIEPAAGGAAHPYAASEAQESGARVSPDGRWAAYTSNESGRDEVYVQSFPTPGRKTLVTAAGGVGAVWRRDGRELYYWDGDQLIAAAVGPGRGGSLAVRGRTPLFRAPYLRSINPNYDVSPDGTRFVIVLRKTDANRLVVVLNSLVGVRPDDRR